MRSRKPVKRSRKCPRGIRKSDGRCKRKPVPKRSRKPRKSRKNRRYNFKVGEDSDKIDDVHIWGHGWDVGEEFKIPERVQSVTYLKDIGCRYYEDDKSNFMETKYTNDYIPNILIAFFGQSDTFHMKITINDNPIDIPNNLNPLSSLNNYILTHTKNKVKITVHACRVSEVFGLYKLPISKDARNILDRTGKLQEMREEEIREEMKKKEKKKVSSSAKYIPPQLRR